MYDEILVVVTGCRLATIAIIDHSDALISGTGEGLDGTHLL